MQTAFWLLLALGCAPAPVVEVSEIGAADPWLRPVEQLARASVSLRGVRPSPAEVLAVHRDPAALAGIVRSYVDDPRFGATVRDLHHEQLQMRSEGAWLPAVGPLADVTEVEVNEAIVEEPLALIEHVVTSGAPYTQIVTGSYTMANPVSAALWGLDGVAAEGGWQPATYHDGRPHAGILATSGLWLRHPSNGANHHRGRAALLAETLLCRDFRTGDAPIDGTVDLTDEDAVVDAIHHNPSCTACHDDLDPLASALWGVRGVVLPSTVRLAHRLGCPEGTAFCYPLAMWEPEPALPRADAGMPEPALFGRPLTGLGDLGAAIAAHPDFATCTVRRFAGWLAQEDPASLDAGWVAERAQEFVKSGFDARQLLVALVLSDRFRRAELEGADAVGLLTVRPEQSARLVESLTGFVWTAQPDPSLAVQDLTTTDRFGYRSMAGGLDGAEVTRPTHQPTPVRALVTAAQAEAAAGFWVARAPDLPTEPAAVRAEIAEWLLAAWSEPEPGAALDELVALFEALLASSGDPARAYTLTLAAILQDPACTTY